jgi:anti-sigma factor RsiW
MRINRPSEHLNDEQLLAYLDGESAKASERAIHEHLKRCWKCRSLQADLEAHVEIISRLLSSCSSSDADRSLQATQHFLEWKNALEKQQPRSFRLWPPPLLMMAIGLVDTHSESDFVLQPST